MIPRVFVSSTYYDLKHVRERLENFIENYGFEPILFESDKVTYQHGKEIDQSAYYEVGLCHIMVLIVGGRYGSPSSQANISDDRKIYDDNYISITRKEFDTAQTKNIPVVIFVDKNVYAEYQTYKKNQELFEELSSAKTKGDKSTKNFEFAHVDHINVFKFIDVIKAKPIKTFEKIEEIETYLKAQFSGMFYLYLESLKKESETNKILDEISELNKVTLMMNAMVESVGKVILSKDDINEYEKVIQNQLAIIIDSFCEQFSSSIEFVRLLSKDELDNVDLLAVAKLIYDTILNIEISLADRIIGFNAKGNITESMMNNLRLLDSNLFKIYKKIRVLKFNYSEIIQNFQQKVRPFLKNPSDVNLLLESLKDTIERKLLDNISISLITSDSYASDTNVKKIKGFPNV